MAKIETDPGEAEQLRRQAREIIAYIADHISTSELRASFLNKAEVRTVLETQSTSWKLS